MYGSSAFIVVVMYFFPFGCCLFQMALLDIFQWLEQL